MPLRRDVAARFAGRQLDAVVSLDLLDRLARDERDVSAVPGVSEYVPVCAK